MTSQRGVALVFALMVLAFLTVLGGALLTTSAIDIRISDNLKTGVQSLYIAEAGIDAAREFLRASPDPPTDLLTRAAGSDGLLSNAVDLASLLASDDQPLLPSLPALRATGEALTDASGEIIGRYHVWLRNDHADGLTARTDTNQVLRILSASQIGNTRKLVEVTIRKAGFAVDDPALQTTAGFENVVARIAANATDVYWPPGTPQTIANYGSVDDYRIAVVNGDVHLSSGTGYGIIIAHGDVNIEGGFTWNGLIFILDPGTLRWNDSYGRVNGGVFIDGMQAADSRIHYDEATMAAANRVLPYVPVAIVER